MIIAGKTFAEVAQIEGTSTRRVHTAVELSFLAPEVLDAIASGAQPIGLTSDVLIKQGFPALWSEQGKQVAAH